MKVKINNMEYIIPMSAIKSLERRANLKGETPYILKIGGYIAKSKHNLIFHVTHNHPEILIPYAKMKTKNKVIVDNI
ncbi:MAG: hypothetical protein ACYDAO_10600 [Thermoplasmataceae archaeon]